MSRPWALPARYRIAAAGCRAVMLACGLLVTVAATPALAGTAADVSEYQVKGAFLLNLIRLVEWPSSAAARNGATLSVCVLGDSPIVPVLESQARTPVKGRRIAVRRVARVENESSCDVLFISDAIGNQLESVVRAVSPGTLTVSEVDTNEKVGAVINFVVEDDRVGFDVSLAAAAHAQLEMSSRLLTVARTVDGRKRRRD
jgi:hypothetical protein